MKKIVLLFLISFGSFAQENHAPLPPIPLEATFGHARLNFQAVLTRPISKNGKLGFFNLSTAAADYANTPTETEMVVINNLTYTLAGNFKAAAGAQWNNKFGLVPQIGMQYFKANRTWLLVLNPSITLQPVKNFETLGLVEYKPALSKSIQLYTRAQVLYIQNLQDGQHGRSAIILRAGLSFSKFTLGLGANFDYYGPKKMEKDNVGLFARLNL